MDLHEYEWMSFRKILLLIQVHNEVQNELKASYKD